MDEITYSKIIKTMDNIKSKIKFTDEQMQSIKDSIKYKLNIIVGYPGTGKTTIMNYIIKTLKNIMVKIIIYVLWLQQVKQ